MKPETIRKKYFVLFDKVLKAKNKLKEFQDSCPHPRLRYRDMGSTGNWDSGDDSYWRDWFCPDCRKQWTGTQDKRAQDEYPQAIKACKYSEKSRYLYNNFYNTDA